MGMDGQTTSAIKQGLDLVSDFAGMVNNQDTDNPYAAEAEAKARLTEQDTLNSASDQRHKARREAAEFRASAEAERAARHANWGSSNLAMRGSKRLVNRSDRLKDKQHEADILFQGDQDAQSTLNQGRHQGNLLRINNDAAANNTTLSMGSKLYKYGG